MSCESAPFVLVVKVFVLSEQIQHSHIGTVWHGAGLALCAHMRGFRLTETHNMMGLAWPAKGHPPVSPGGVQALGPNIIRLA